MPVILETPRLLLRTWTLDDAEAAFGIYSDPEVLRYLTIKAHETVAQTRALLAERPIAHQERHGFSLWAVLEKATSALVGVCGLKYLDDTRDIEVGYHFARAAWGRGYATEAAGACLRYGFERLALPRILGVVDPDNVASQRVLEKLGMTFKRMGHYYGKELRVYTAEPPRGIPSA
jgi:[ribosomal protein S5]-alanine N-acetyltransferase